MRRAGLPILLSALVLAGCASPPDHWYRAATDPDTASRDERTCRQEAVQVARQQSRVDANILQDRQSAPSYSAGLTYPVLNLSRDELASDEQVNIRELTRACMADLGYRLVRDD